MDDDNVTDQDTPAEENLTDDEITSEEDDTSEEDADIEAAFMAGATADTSGKAPDNTPAPDTSTEGEEAAAAAHAEEEAAAAAAAPVTDTARLLAQIDEMSARLRRTEGHMGRIQEDIRSAASATKAAGGDAPTTAQVNKALTDVAEFNNLREEFPEFAATLEAVFNQVGMGGGPVQPAMSQDEIMRVAVEAAREAAVESFIDEKHEGWTETINTPRFGAWLRAQDDATKALGASARAGDAIKMLDLYADFDSWVSAQGPDSGKFTDAALLENYAQAGVESGSANTREGKRQSSRNRLEGSVPATIPGGRTERDEPTDEIDNAFLQGWKNAR